MTPPRYIVKDQLVDVTMQAVGRSFRFLPTRNVRDSLQFVFALLVAKYGLLVHEFEFMSNHLHFVATDVDGELPNFMREFDSLLARQLNAVRGSTGGNIEKGYGLLLIADGAKLLEKVVYILANAVSAHLVERVKQWKGPNSLNLNYGQAVTFQRPKCGMWAQTRADKPRNKFESRGRRAYRGRSDAPEEIEFTLVRPGPAMPELSDTQLRTRVRELLGERERALIEQRRQTGQTVLGMRAVLQQHYLDTPERSRVLFETKPRVSGKDPRKRAAKLKCLVGFESAYRIARDVWLKGERSVVFPFGTWLMLSRFGVQCATAPP